MKTYFVIVVGIMLTMISCLAANPVPYTFDVQGLIPFEKYTDAQTRANLGNNPLKMDTWDDGEVVGREYEYGVNDTINSIFFRGKQDEFSGFILVDSTFSLFEGHLKVGNHISKVAQLGGGLLELKETDSENGKLYYFYPVGQVSEKFLAIITDLNGIIECMWAEPPM